jgi:hypothetical protein
MGFFPGGGVAAAMRRLGQANGPGLATGLGTAIGFAFLVVLAGCLGGPGAGDGGTTSPGTPTDGQSGVETYVFDSSPHAQAVVEGGIHAPGRRDDYTTSRYYVTTLKGASEAERRFNRSELDAAGRAFVDETDFESSFLAVVQAYPQSSVPDYRVETARLSGGTLSLDINDSSPGGTADVTVETLLVRVDGKPPSTVRVTTDDGTTWSSGDGVVTRTPEPTSTQTGVPLPYRAEDPAENIAEPRDVLIENRGNATNGFRLEIEYLEAPECRDETPPCGMPAREIAVLGKTGKLRPGETTRVTDVAARRGPYTVAVVAEVPGTNGSRERVQAAIHWELDGDAPDVHVIVTDSSVRFVTPASAHRATETGASKSPGSTGTTRRTSPR